jgi:hypothetical protein
LEGKGYGVFLVFVKRVGEIGVCVRRAFGITYAINAR